MNLKQVGIIMVAILFVYGCKNNGENQDESQDPAQKESQKTMEKEMQPQSQPGDIEDPTQQTQSKASDISDEELEKFANVLMAEQEVQQDMVDIIEKEGMEVQRFQQMQQASGNPEKELDATDEEKKKFETVKSSLQEMQPQVQKKIQEKIKEEGLTRKRYQEINRAMQNDQKLQKKLRSVFQKKQQGQQKQPVK